jgi:hypothetical protein
MSKYGKESGGKGGMGHGMHPPKRDGHAPKTASLGAGHSDGGGSKEICDAAKALNSPKKGGLPGV